MTRAADIRPVPGAPSRAAARPVSIAICISMAMPMCMHSSSALSQEESGHEAGQRM